MRTLLVIVVALSFFACSGSSPTAPPQPATATLTVQTPHPSVITVSYNDHPVGNIDIMSLSVRVPNGTPVTVNVRRMDGQGECTDTVVLQGDFTLTVAP